MTFAELSWPQTRKWAPLVTTGFADTRLLIQPPPRARTRKTSFTSHSTYRSSYVLQLQNHLLAKQTPHLVRPWGLVYSIRLSSGIEVTTIHG